MISVKLENASLAENVFFQVVRGANDRKKIIKEVLIPAAKIVKKVMIEMAPTLKVAPVFNVYRTPKLSGKQKAPKGMGVIYVAIKPGQMKKSISYFQTPATRKAGAINVGPRYKKGVWKKPEKGGWYMHMLQFGTDTVKPQQFVLPALIATSSGVGKMMEMGMTKRLRSVVKKDGKGVLEFVG